MNAPVCLSTVTAKGVTDALKMLKPGQRVVYHTGSLMFDRQRGLEFGRVHGAAKAAWDAYTAGLVTLVQRKLAPLKYEYIAIRRNATKVKPKHREKVTA